MALLGLKANASLRIKGNIFSDESIYQQPVLNIQTGVGLDPGASPTKGDRYIIEASGSLHANFGVITGVGDDDIVEYDGSSFVIVYDASVQGSGAKTFDKNSVKSYEYNGTAWSTAAHPDGGDGVTFNNGANRFDLDLVDANSGLEMTASDGSGELQLSSQGNGIAGGAGSLLSVDPATEVAGSRAAIYLGADGVGINLDNSTLDHSSSTLQVKDLGIVEGKIGAGAVTNGKLGADAVNGDKIADDSIGSEHIAAGAVDTLALGADAVDGTKIADNSIGNEHMLNDAINTDEIVNLAVTNAKLGADAVDGSKIADDSIGAEHILTGAVGSLEIAADAVNGDKIADDSIGAEHLGADSVDLQSLNHADTKLRSGALSDPFTASLTRTFTHNWNTSDVQVEIYDSVTGETCLVESIIRAANTIAITLNQTPDNDLRVLLKEVNATETVITVA
jgi:hypothetical protein